MEANPSWDDEAVLWIDPPVAGDMTGPKRWHEGTLATAVRCLLVELEPRLREQASIRCVTADGDIKSEEAERLASLETYPFHKGFRA